MATSSLISEDSYFLYACPFHAKVVLWNKQLMHIHFSDLHQITQHLSLNIWLDHWIWIMITIIYFWQNYFANSPTSVLEMIFHLKAFLSPNIEIFITHHFFLGNEKKSRSILAILPRQTFKKYWGSPILIVRDIIVGSISGFFCF